MAINLTDADKATIDELLRETAIASRVRNLLRAFFERLDPPPVSAAVYTPPGPPGERSADGRVDLHQGTRQA
jgi:hypothetical protein